MILDFFKEKVINQYGEEIFDEIIEGMKSRHSSFRINSLKSNHQEIEKILDLNKISFEKCDWYADAYIVKDERKIKELDIFKDGKIYMQSLSSMLPALVLNPQKGENILDMCAAPGGKTTQMAALSQNGAYITACEKNKVRYDRLKYNIEKQGASSVYVMQKDSRNIDDFFSFDRILLDAPCSGSGTLELNNESTFKYFSQKLVEKSTKTQLALLKKALKILKPGNELIYSTCSILCSENEDIVNQVLKLNNAEIIPIEFKGMEELPTLPTKIPGTLCVCPNEYYEGFFVAKIRKIN